MAEQHKSHFAEIEEEMLAQWEKEGTFEKSLAQREGAPYFSFYDGPPFANGLPHFGHSLVTSIKDSILRYKTLRGYYVPRRNGWDCHGLPVEYAIEKEFRVSGKQQIMELGLEKFNAACRESIFRYKANWEEFLKRIGRWSEYDNYYATVDRDYTESVWWVLSKIHEQGLLYRGYKSVAYCPRCETPLSNFEVNEGYRDKVSDPSLFVKFKLKNEDGYLLGWTTTPWSLPGNAAIAVNPSEQYVYVQLRNDEGQEETLVLAKKRLEILNDTDYTVVKEVTGKQLVGLSYEPVFRLGDLAQYEGHEKLYKVWAAPFVSIDDGTGVLHVAPAFGEDDLNLGQEVGLPVLSTVDGSGKLKGGIGFDAVGGKFFKGADRPIIEYLTTKGLVFAAETLQHTYPFCWRCDTPLLYYAISAWFIKVSAIKDKLLKTAKEINWTPAHIKKGRFGKWLEGAKDWGISRNRYWGAPLPIWVNDNDSNDYIVVGSIEELQKLAGGDAKLEDLHRPLIDQVTFEKDGKRYRRIEEVLDCWFESGSMAVAQHHYPFENEAIFDNSFPANFIIEGLDQTRQWFYVQHVVATILFGRPAYKNVIANGMLMAADGQKLSKRLKNYPPTQDVFDQEGADAWRLYLLSSNQATETADYSRFDRQALKDIQRNVLGTLWNSYNFFKMYADIDNWKPASDFESSAPKSENILDNWLIARLNETNNEVTKQADNYKIAHSVQPLFSLIDDLSNWYVRRSRRRFWKSDDDEDKRAAYATLHFVLVRICQLLAPWAPFISDKIYRGLTRGTSLPVSVHLTNWPPAENSDIQLLQQMEQAREYINQGLAQRAAAKIKVRQPLARVNVPRLPNAYKELIAEELNVKEVAWLDEKAEVVLNTALSETLRIEGVMRELVRHTQNARKNAGLRVEDRIKLYFDTEDPSVQAALNQHAETIKAETLALDLQQPITPEYTEIVKINGSEMTIHLAKIH
jgi:isoleucyl-tRNA synthetase